MVETVVAQDRGNGRGARVDIGVDIQRPHQRHQRRVVDQRDGHARARLLGPDRGQDVRLVVIGHGQNRVGGGNRGLVQQFDRQAVAVQHDGPFQPVGGEFGARAVALDQLGADAVGPRL